MFRKLLKFLTIPMWSFKIIIFASGLYHPEKNENGNKAGQNAGQGFGSVNHQGNYNSNSGYKY